LADETKNVIEVEGLTDEAADPKLLHLSGEIPLLMATHKVGLDAVPRLLNEASQFRARDVRHVDVTHDEVGLIVVEPLAKIPGVGEKFNRKGAILNGVFKEHRIEKFHLVFIIDYCDCFGQSVLLERSFIVLNLVMDGKEK
jgi:hypothetical protein